VGRRNADDGEQQQEIRVDRQGTRRKVIGPKRHGAVKRPLEPRRSARPLDIVLAEHEPAFEHQQEHIKRSEETEHGERRCEVRRDHRVMGALRVAQVHQQGQRHEDHHAERGEQGQPGHRLETLHAEHVVEAGNRERAGHQARQVRVNDYQDAPLDDALVGVHVARERRGIHHETSLSMPT
jgi:hypothetical protein